MIVCCLRIVHAAAVRCHILHIAYSQIAHLLFLAHQRYMRVSIDLAPREIAASYSCAGCEALLLLLLLLGQQDGSQFMTAFSQIARMIAQVADYRQYS
jgi:hypothetical protein